MQNLIYRCAELHIDHIVNGGDPFETGSSRPLDFGHWAAHKLEHLTHYELRHGEAVALGMAIDVGYSAAIGWIPEEVQQRIVKVLENLGFNLVLPDQIEDVASKVLEGIEEFREHLGGKLTITLLKGIGAKCDVHEIDSDLMKEVILGLGTAKK
jgi:3-dehydroquinate synthase